LEDLSLHILDIAENSIAAGAKNIEIKILEDTKNDKLTIEIKDDGKGMTQEEINKATDPFFTSRTTRRVGLGLSLFKQAAESANGKMEIASEIGKGTCVTASFQLSHFDRQPLGNMAETIIMLMTANADIEIIYEYRKDDKSFIFDTKEVKKSIKEVQFKSATVLSFVKKYIEENIEILKIN
jgi:signal transduction histidine kinase